MCSVQTNDMQTPPSVLIPLSRNMRNVLKRMKKQFAEFYFLNYRENSSKMTITRKIKNGKICFFFLFSRFWIFHVNLTSFEKKNILMFDFFFVWMQKPLIVTCSD